MSADRVDQEEPARILDWLRVVGAVRGVEEPEPGVFVVELPNRRLLAIPAESVAVFRAGVLAGWRLPRPSSEVLG